MRTDTAGPIDKKRLEKACFEVARRRLQGYLSVIEPRGPKTSVKIWECLRSSEEDGRTAAEYFLAKKPRPTAILATSDRLALGVMEVARSYQLRIPEDLAVVGFDDIPAARMSAPQLTTVGQPFEEKGRAAVAALLKEKGPLRTILPKSLIVRQSSDPAVLRRIRGNSDKISRPRFRPATCFEDIVLVLVLETFGRRRFVC